MNEKFPEYEKASKWAFIHATMHSLIYLAILILLFKVTPVLEETFETFGADLPYPTRIIFSISDFFKSYFLIIAPVFFFGGAFIVFNLYFNIKVKQKNIPLKKYICFSYFLNFLLIFFIFVAMALPLIKIGEIVE